MIVSGNKIGFFVVGEFDHPVISLYCGTFVSFFQYLKNFVKDQFVADRRSNTLLVVKNLFTHLLVKHV